MATVNATVTWKQEMRFEGVASLSNQTVVLDAAPEHGGQNSGPRPMELLLKALGGCTGMDVVSMLKKMRQEFTDYRVVISGERTADNPQRYTSITVEHVITGQDLDNEKIEKAVRLSETKYCSVSATLANGAAVAHRWTVNK